MATPIVPHMSRPRGKSRWSLPLLVTGAIAAVFVGQRYDGLLGGFTLVGAVLVAKVLDEFAVKRARQRVGRVSSAGRRAAPSEG